LTRPRDATRINRVRFPWQHDYARTCDECGYTWRVPRSAVRRRMRTISGFMVAPQGRSLDRFELGREVQSISAEKQAFETFQHCPACGADRFTQHAVSGDPGPSA
jgi:predicted nucleic-acid-binding Zn-ribbon protein